METNKEKTITYGLGRFVIDIPASMHYRGGTYSMRIRDIKELLWHENDLNKSAEAQWKARIDEIEKLNPVEGKDSALIEVKKLSNIRKWCRAVYYYGDSFDDASGYLDILLNTGRMGVWIKTNGKITGKDFMYEKSTDLAKAYRAPAHPSGTAEVIAGRDSFYLRYGAVDLPFEYEESVGIYFEGHLIDKTITVEIDSDVVHEVQPVGLIGRFEAAIATGYVQGLKIRKIRAKERIVAGEKGEEFIYMGIEEDGDKKIYYLWEFPGKADSGEHPELSVTMDSDHSKLEEKLALWDSILDSMRPAGR